MLLSKAKETKAYPIGRRYTGITRELREHNLKPTPAMELVCEYFETIWSHI